jgi:hypothetical protein
MILTLASFFEKRKGLVRRLIIRMAYVREAPCGFNKFFM